MSVSHLAELRAALARVRRRWSVGRWLRGIARVCVGISVVLLVILLVELRLTLPDIPMLLLAALALVAALGFVVWVVRPLRNRPTDRRVARFIEERCPQLQDSVASAAQLAESKSSNAFRELVFADAARRLSELDLAHVVTKTYLRRAAVRGGVSVAVLSAVLTFGYEPIVKLFGTGWLYAFPGNFTLEVEPGDFNLLTGQPLQIHASLVGGAGAVVRTPPILSVFGDSGLRVIRMRPVEGGFLAEFPSVVDSFHYEISTATLRTRRYRVEALTPPRVLQVDLEYDYPSYTGLASRVEEDGGDVFAPAGTEVRLRVYANKPIADGMLVLGDGRRVVLDTTTDNVSVAKFLVENDDSYRIVVTDNYGLTNRQGAEYFIRATFDRLPEVEVIRPGGDRTVTPLEEVTIQVRADDDYRVDALELVYQVAGRPEQLLSFDIPTSAATVTGMRTLYVEDLAVAPGDFITYYARVRDVGLSGESTEMRSDIFFLEIRPFGSEFEEARSQSARGGDVEELGNLARLQKQIVVATWRLDQNSNQTAVAEDIRAVATAQGELGEVAARAAERIRGRGRERAAGETGPAPVNVAMEAAVEAMMDAEAALLKLDTGAAMLSEMEALRQILTVEAAVRRRQVSMARGQGAQSSGNQAQQDLSALFDRELMREQETSYETESSAAPATQADNESEALRRLRQLSERQEQLNRELNQRGETESAEQRRRVLERLTREQQQLREQLERLASELSRQAENTVASGQGQVVRGDLQPIAEQMRRTLSDLRRSDTNAARDRGAQVLDEMRRFEQRLRGPVEAERVRALADLQLEAHQLADAQRRMAEEVGEVATDNRGLQARIRLANEKDDLADRVDSLDQAIADLDGSADGINGAGRLKDDPVWGARETLDRESVSRRMRMGSDRLRRSASAPFQPAGGAPREEWSAEETALADTLAMVAELLHRGGETGGLQQDLQAQLDTVRKLRQQLRELERDLDSLLGEGGAPARGTASPGGERSTSRGSSQPEVRSGEVAARRQSATSGLSEPEQTGGQTAAGSVGQARREFVEGLEAHPALLDRLRRANSELDRDLEQWAQYWRSGSAPGSELYKLDLGRWASLRRNLDNALQHFEAEGTRELSTAELRGRVTAGSDGSLPARYQGLVDQYFRSVAVAPVSP